ncbi:FAD binding domain-containing protein [Tardiphaga sp. 538_B7_N1_4]|jgi:carbon-monoxide dehydrogenase medium subunit|uniref:FAD binding domain-containing protein n=1 Tax=Tardiphaga sp. 538_B7_N1_4 TaxID=3240778 RepID=UPI003F2970C0
MKPASFDYMRPDSVAHAVQLLSGAGGDAKIIAGGQSLMPMMNFRLVKPSLLVDINAIPELDGIEHVGDKLRIGALVRHRMTAESADIAASIPVLHAAMKHVAHLTVRNRGTFCGSVCHADPAAEMPMMTLLLNGVVNASSVRGNRAISAHEFFAGALVTVLKPDEMVTSIDIDTLPEGVGWGFEEFSRRHGDYALAAVAVTMIASGGVARDVRIGIMGVGETPMRMPGLENMVEGSAVNDRLKDDLIHSLGESISPNSDLNGSAEYRRHLAGVLLSRAISDAWTRANRGHA